MARTADRATAVELAAVFVGQREEHGEIRTDIDVRSPEEGTADAVHLADLGAAILLHLYERKVFDESMGRFAAHLRAQGIAVQARGGGD